MKQLFLAICLFFAGIGAANAQPVPGLVLPQHYQPAAPRVQNNYYYLPPYQQTYFPLPSYYGYRPYYNPYYQPYHYGYGFQYSFNYRFGLWYTR